VKAVRALTDGAGVDYAFVTVGNVLAINQAFKMVRRGGSVVAIGLPEASATVDLRVHSLVSGERRILGSFMGSTRLSVDVPKLVELYQQGRLKLDELISNCYSLEQINEAIAAMEHGAALRNVIVFPQ
jgi:S-(hydroxymethyl)glutathione dehydrogenase/alcohol dehydrogenase